MLRFYGHNCYGVPENNLEIVTKTPKSRKSGDLRAISSSSSSYITTALSVWLWLPL
jgi:hypothetical protein